MTDTTVAAEPREVQWSQDIRFAARLGTPLADRCLVDRARRLAYWHLMHDPMRWEAKDVLEALTGGTRDQIITSALALVGLLLTDTGGVRGDRHGR